MTSTGFYRAFEERYRGPRELIKQRLEVYLPFIAPLLQWYEPAAAIDLGCGRGEWLELLQEKGFLPQGVDLDEGMLESCRERGLPATQGDAIAYLKSLADATQCIVSGFHIVEHIPFDDLQTLVIEALRVLKPGGLLILETPNPENVVVGTTNFYLDPTHLRPIPPLLLSFLPEHYGYERVKTLRLQESPELAAKENIGLFEVFAGVSPDYAVVAQKNASPEVLCAFDAAFAKHHGIELNELANRYDAGLERSISTLGQRMANVESQAGGMSDALARITVLQDRLIDAVSQAERNAARAQAAEGKADAAESRATEAESRATEAVAALTAERERALWLESEWNAAKATINELHQSNHRWWLSADGFNRELQAVYASRSWRLTKPLRRSFQSLRDLRHNVKQAVKPPLKLVLAKAIHFVQGHPQIKERALAWVRKHPTLEIRLRRFALGNGLLGSYGMAYACGQEKKDNATHIQDSSAESAHLTPRALHIYADLKAAIESRQKESG